MELLTVLELLRQFGPALAILIFLLVRDSKREDRLSKRIHTLEDEMRAVVLPLVKECTKVITENTEAFRSLRTKLDR